MVKLTAPEGASSVGFVGREYAVEGGCVEVPDAAVAALAAHGYQRPDPAAALSRPAPRKR